MGAGLPTAASLMSEEPSAEEGLGSLGRKADSASPDRQVALMLGVWH